MTNLVSERIRLVNCDEPLLKSLLKGEDHLSRVLGITIPDQWSEFGTLVFKYVLHQIEKNPAEVKWYIYLPIDQATNTLLGTCGYKGQPDATGTVEIGYEVAAAFRNQGYATEITELLIRNAFADAAVQAIQAHTLAEKNASVRVLEKCKFKFVEELIDEEDGKIWKWVLKKHWY